LTLDLQVRKSRPAARAAEDAMSCQPLFVITFAALFAAPTARPSEVKIEFRAGGRCTITIHDDASRSDRVVDLPGPATPPSEYSCAILPPRRRPIELSVMLPQGEAPSGAEFPRLAWTERAGRWIGSASLPAAPSFVRIPRNGSVAARRARLLDWAALAATAIAILWTIKFGIRN
jgi:hypothetical protein